MTSGLWICTVSLPSRKLLVSECKWILLQKTVFCWQTFLKKTHHHDYIKGKVMKGRSEENAWLSTKKFFFFVASKIPPPPYPICWKKVMARIWKKWKKLPLLFINLHLTQYSNINSAFNWPCSGKRIQGIEVWNPLFLWRFTLKYCQTPAKMLFWTNLYYPCCFKMPDITF